MRLKIENKKHYKKTLKGNLFDGKSSSHRQNKNSITKAKLLSFSRRGGFFSFGFLLGIRYPH